MNNSWLSGVVSDAENLDDMVVWCLRSRQSALGVALFKLRGSVVMPVCPTCLNRETDIPLPVELSEPCPTCSGRGWVLDEEAQRKVYVASSWRNPAQPDVVQAIRDEGHEVYDFRNPEPGDTGFHWSDIEPDWQEWDVERYVKALDHPVAIDGFGKDKAAMEWADTFVLVLPCGRSAHLELGWAIGAGKPSVILMLGENEPELMYKLADLVTPSLGAVLAYLEHKEE